MGFSSPERAQPVWRPGPFILGRDWTRASRRVGLQQFCRAQISLCAQSEPLAGRDICCLTFLIYTSPPSHTNTRFCSPPFQTSPSPSITERARKNRRDLGTCTGGWGGGGSVTRFAEFGKLCVRDSQQLVAIHLMLSGSEEGGNQGCYTSHSSPSICARPYTSPTTMSTRLLSYVF